MSETIDRKNRIPFINLLLTVAIAAIFLGLAGKTFYDVMFTLRSVSAANYYYREAFRLQTCWRSSVGKIGTPERFTPDEVIGSRGRIVIWENMICCEITGGQRFTFPIPDEFRLRASWDKQSNLAVLTVSRQACAEPPLRLAAVINGEVTDAPSR